jgi:regulator of protease activity HflC (stomatin/prohibitin superfamily)
MSPLVLIVIGALVLVLVIVAFSSIRVVQQYERGVHGSEVVQET